MQPIYVILVLALLTGCSVQEIDGKIKKGQPGSLQGFNLMGKKLPPVGIRTPFGAKLPPIGIKTPFGAKLPPIVTQNPLGYKFPAPK